MSKKSKKKHAPDPKPLVALDLFAGTGWGVACQWLGIEEYGVEIMPEAVESRTRNGMTTLYRDVWQGLFTPAAAVYNFDILIASPPCQTFSMAGSGAGRKALDDVLEAIETRAYLDPAKLRAFGEKHDPRTALVLTPLAHVARDVPMYVVFEQVPPVLPVWEACAEHMRAWGYSVWTGNLQAEMYGVPQTRKRAVLIARADGVEAAPPTPTHSRYYSRDPQRLDPGVLPWVSMAEALGWGLTERPFVTAGNAVGRAEGIGGSGGKAVITGAKERGAWLAPVMRSNYGTGGDASSRGEREGDEPTPTMTSKADRNMWQNGRPSTTVNGDPRISEPGWRGGRADYQAGRPIENQHDKSVRVTIEEAAALQSYPAGFTFAGTKTKQFLQVGNAVPPLLAAAILKGFLS